jgi:hypothetical protein
MTGAGRLSSGPQPVMTSSACTLPLAWRCLSARDGLRSGRAKPQTPRQGWSPKGGKPGVSQGFSGADSPVPEGDAPTLRRPGGTGFVWVPYDAAGFGFSSAKLCSKNQLLIVHKPEARRLRLC